MYHQINPTETFRERQVILLDEAANRRLAWRLRTGRESRARSIAAAPPLGFLAVLVIVAGIMLLGPSSPPAHADTTFTVNSTRDESDTNTDDGECDADFTSANPCTLRAAMEQANATPGADTINFNIPGTGVHTINPTRGAGLPAITERLIIDGYTQGELTPDPADDAKENTLQKGTNAQLRIELDGTNAGSIGLFIDTGGSGSVIRGLVVNRFSSEGIQVQDSSQNRIEGNFIGTDPSGTLDLGNGGIGVDILAVDASSTFNTVGGNKPEQRNLISGNDQDGVRFATVLSGTTSSNRVENNLIGTKKGAATALDNSFDGVLIANASNNTVSSNTIAFNGGDGVVILESPNTDKANGNFLAGNSIFSNVQQGIDLANDGVTSNDSLDSDPGPNNLQNSPLLTSAKTTKKGTTIIGSLNSTPTPINGSPKTFIVQFFSNASGDEGQRFIGQTGVTTDSSGNASFTFKPAQKLRRGNITATATDTASLNTSEFSAAKKVVVRKRR